VLVHGVTASTRTWWRVGLWFAQNGWRAVAVDLRGHGASPGMQGDEGLDNLAADLHETVLEEPGTVDVLLGHYLGALVAMKLCESHSEPARRLVLEEPPGSRSTDFGEVAREALAGAFLARGSLEEAVQRNLAENPTWAREAARNSVAGLLDCDAGPVAGFLREGLRYDLAEMVRSVSIPTLLVLGSEEHGSMLPVPERGRGWLAAAGHYEGVQCRPRRPQRRLRGVRPATRGLARRARSLGPQPVRRPAIRAATDSKAVLSAASSRGSSSKSSSTLRRAFRMSWSVSQGFFGNSEPCR
jgi:pimeloyl-ACP methyl ester carboxylesterase